MKILLILMTTFLIQVSATTFAQKITLKEKQASMVSIFEKINKQSGIDFLVNIELMVKAKPVSINVKNEELSVVLDKLFEGQPLSYTLNDRAVVVTEKKPSLIDKVKEYFASKDIYGKVVDEEGNPLPGASVKVKNSKQVTVTNQDGEFFLKGVGDDVSIVISYIGYINAEISSNIYKPGIYITLKRSESKLDEVQVMAYGTTTRRTSTSNIATIKAEDITKQDVSNPLLALQGRVAGLIITPTSGLPGGPISVQLRGVNTLGNISGLKKTSEPLFVIDGVPYTNNIPDGSSNAASVNGEMSAFSFVNPADIESIDVLKDADATAIYGSRGANGVILVTTKKGRIGSNSINVNLSSGFGEVTKKLKLLNTQQYLEMRKEAYKNDGLPLPTNPSLTNYDLTVWDQSRYTDWQEELLGGTAKHYNAQIGVSGGSSIIQYLISGNYNQQGYVFPGDAKNESGNGHFSITGNSLNNKFRATLTGTYAVSKRISGIDFTSMAMQLAPNAPAIYQEDGTLNWEPNPNTGLGTWENPYARLLVAATTKSNGINSNADLSYQVFPSLLIKANIGFNELRGNSFAPSPIAAISPANLAAGVATGSSSFITNLSRSWSVEPQGLYRMTIGRGNLEAIVGATLQYQNVGLQQLYAYGYQSDALLGNLSSAESYFAYNSSSQYKYKGVFGRLTYNWGDKYVFNLNGRRDGSSRFGPKQQYGNFGSVGAAWIFSNEAFLQKKLPFMSFGKLRFSYGTSGNDGIGDYMYLELYGNLDDLGNPIYRGAQGLVSGGVTNPYYHWEEIRKAEIALETGFFKDRILFSAAYFRNRSNDQLGAFTLPSTAGNGSNFVVNQNAKIQNSGLEFMLNTRNIKTKTFNWSTSANLSMERNKLLALPAGGSTAYGLNFPEIGKPFSGIVYPYVFRGVDPVTGRYQFQDVEGNPTVTNLAQGLVSLMTSPKFYGGVSNSFSYKGFSLDVFFQFTKQLGRNYLYDPSRVFSIPGGFNATSNANMPVEVLARWQKPGDVSSIQRFTTRRSAEIRNSWDAAAFSTDAYVDASFIRLKNLSISYVIPELWKQKLGMKNLRVYLQGQNLLTITNYKGLDPETQTIRLPQLRLLTAGIQAGF